MRELRHYIGEQLRFAQLGCPIRKSPDHRLLRTSPRHIVATPRPSSPFLVKASTIYPYANHPNADFIHHKYFVMKLLCSSYKKLDLTFPNPPARWEMLERNPRDANSSRKNKKIRCRASILRSQKFRKAESSETTSTLQFEALPGKIQAKSVDVQSTQKGQKIF